MEPGPRGVRRLKPGDHFDGRQFRNLRGTAGLGFAAVPRMMIEPRRPWPRWIEVTPVQPPPLDGAAAVFTFIGHSTFLVQTAAGNILTDPMYSMRAGPFNLIGPRRTRPPAVRLADLPPISMVLLSHNHYDHCDLRTLRTLARRFDPLVVTPLGNARLVRRTGIRRVEELDWWESSSGSPVPVTLTPAQHFAARTPWDRNRALWCGFVFETGGRKVLFAGDSGYGGHFAMIRDRFGPMDVAMLPIGAYEPRWFMQPIHMNPEEAVQAHVDLEASLSIGMHFGTFQLTLEGIDEPARALTASLHSRSMTLDTFLVPGFGESLRL